MLDDLVRTCANLHVEKAHSCLQSAELLLANEAYADSANRSYYAIFHSMQAVLTTVGFSSKKHSGSIAEFQKSFVKTGVFCKIHSDILKDAFKVRNKSDYDIHYIVVKAEVVEQLANAKVFLSAVEEYLSSL